MNSLLSTLVLLIVVHSSHAALSHQSLDKLRLLPEITAGSMA